MPADVMDLETPCLLLDEQRLRANVARMKTHLASLGVAFRPHLKTAKSLDVARSFGCRFRCPGWFHSAQVGGLDMRDGQST